MVCECKPYVRILACKMGLVYVRTLRHNSHIVTCVYTQVATSSHECTMNGYYIRTLPILPHPAPPQTMAKYLLDISERMVLK